MTQYAPRCPFLPGTTWRIYKVRPGTEGFPGLVIYFSIEEGNAPVLVLHDVILSDDGEHLDLPRYVARAEEWEWEKANGHGTW